MCTVSVLLEADRNMPSMLKAREQMLTHLRREGRGRPHCCPDAEGRRQPAPPPPPEGTSHRRKVPMTGAGGPSYSFLVTFSNHVRKESV